ncbi:MAG: hypothetical protein AAF488_06330 [Planctomycetota bacterium]
MVMDKIRKLFQRREIPRDARDLVNGSQSPKEVLQGLDELITRNEMEVTSINREIEALERVEGKEVERVRAGELPERSKNNVLRRVQRLRKQMDNLEERQRIYNRNINLQIHLVGRIQALEAMELRGVDETAIDSILNDYEEELCAYQNALETEDLIVSDLGPALDDSEELGGIEAEILGEPDAAPVSEQTKRGVSQAPDSITAPSESSATPDADDQPWIDAPSIDSEPVEAAGRREVE